MVGLPSRRACFADLANAPGALSCCRFSAIHYTTPSGRMLLKQGSNAPPSHKYIPCQEKLVFKYYWLWAIPGLKVGADPHVLMYLAKTQA